MKFVTGNLLSAPTEAIVNTVNTVGVMGKGIALQFKERFPQNFFAYKKACKLGNVETGKMFVFKEMTISGEKTIINFPTKKEWFQKSQYSYIEAGLEDLVRVIRNLDIKSIAIPPLGCGNGGLDWEKVKPMLEKYLSDLEGVEILIFEPDANIRKILQNENISKKSKLTPARAMLLYSLFWYEQFGEEATVFAANKIAYLLQESGEDLRLKFTQHHYGPYAQAVEKVLYALNGTYLNGLEQMTASPFEALDLNYKREAEVNEFVNNKISREQKDRLKRVFQLMYGFESALSLEVLTSVYYVMHNNNNKDLDRIIREVKDWNKHKSIAIRDEYIKIAYNHLNKSNAQLQLNFA
jgi:O-acetyl-ADP-ribose deacetylase (regulator of RNase III)